MCIEDYVISLNKSLEPQTTLVPTVKCKLDYDIYDTSTLCLSVSPTKKRCLTPTQGLPAEKNNSMGETIKDDGITCSCCLRGNLARNECVLFIKKNYNMYIKHVADIIKKHVCSQTK